MARMDYYRITFIHFSGVEGDILLQLLTNPYHFENRTLCTLLMERSSPSRTGM